MLRNLGLFVLVGAVVCALTSNSEAGARGNSFKVESSDGTKAGVAFDLIAGVTVHTPDADVNGIYTETALTPPVLGLSAVSAGGFGDGYVGGFNALVIDFLVAPAQIYGVGVGSTGIYFFAGTEKK